MQELIDELKLKAGLTDEQAMTALMVIKDHIKSKLPPMMQDMVDNFIGPKKQDDDFMG